MYQEKSGNPAYDRSPFLRRGWGSVLSFLSATPRASPPPRPSIFFIIPFRVHHLVNQDDWHLLALAMASDFSVAWQCLSKRTIVFFVTDQTPRRNSTSFICYCSPRPVINARATNCQAHHFHCRKNSYLFPNEVSFYVFRKEVSYNSEKSFN
jgi:hypothetical protein